jgi:hypothetical protein
MARAPAASRAKQPKPAAAVNIANRYLCAQPVMRTVLTDPTIHEMRAEAILANTYTWVNGTVIRYYMFTTGKLKGGKADMDAVRKAFKAWKALKIGLDFVEVTDPKKAEIRIGFDQNDGSWSYIGTYCREIKNLKTQTMNFGWKLTDAEGFDTALHEIGHALGLKHEHQNPNAGIVWNEPVVRARLSQPPNSWDDAKIYNNILSKLEPGSVTGSNWDKNSIMHYPFEAGMILKPEYYQKHALRPQGGLSPTDIAWVTKTYPPAGKEKPAKLAPLQSSPVAVVAPGQRVFAVEPTETRRYNLRLFGKADATLLLYEVGAKGEEIYIAGKKDSGTAENAALEERLFTDRKYLVKVKVDYVEDPANLSIMAW